MAHSTETHFEFHLRRETLKKGFKLKIKTQKVHKINVRNIFGQCKVSQCRRNTRIYTNTDS